MHVSFSVHTILHFNLISDKLCSRLLERSNTALAPGPRDFPLENANVLVKRLRTNKDECDRGRRVAKSCPVTVWSFPQSSRSRLRTEHAIRSRAIMRPV